MGVYPAAKTSGTSKYFSLPVLLEQLPKLSIVGYRTTFVNPNPMPIKTGKAFIDLTEIFACCRPTVTFSQVAFDFFLKTFIC